MPSYNINFEEIEKNLRAAGLSEEQIRDNLRNIGAKDERDPSPSLLQPSGRYAATSWGHPNEFDFTTSSGQVCRLKRLDPIELLGMGLVDKLDILTGVVANEHIPNAEMSQVDRLKKKSEQAKKMLEEGTGLSNMMSNPKRLAEFKNMLNEVLVSVVIQPRLAPVPPAGARRYDGVIYVDSVPFSDRMEVFNAVMGRVNQLEPFREEASESVGTVASVQDVQLPSE